MREACSAVRPLASIRHAIIGSRSDRVRENINVNYYCADRETANEYPVDRRCIVTNEPRSDGLRTMDAVREAEIYVNNLRKIDIEKNVTQCENSEHQALRSIARVYRIISHLGF